jgi:hypothetical protein
MNHAVKQTRPFSLWLLIASLLFLSFGAFIGGVGFLRDTSGAALGMDLSYIKGSVFPNYLIPGLFLLFVLGILPLVVIWALLKQPGWKFAADINPIKQYHWVWTAAVLIGVLLIVFEIIEAIVLGGFIFFLQELMFAVGIVIVLLAFLPGVRRYYAD